MLQYHYSPRAQQVGLEHLGMFVACHDKSFATFTYIFVHSPGALWIPYDPFALQNARPGVDLRTNSNMFDSRPFGLALSGLRLIA